MPSKRFDVDSYSLRALPGGSTPYVIILQSGVEPDGRRSYAVIEFRPADSLPSHRGFVFGASPVTFSVTALAYADEQQFETLHHIIQTEDPLEVVVSYDSVARGADKLTYLAVNTGKEPTGEGLADLGTMALVASGDLDLEALDPAELGVADVETLRPPDDFAEEIRAAVSDADR